MTKAKAKRIAVATLALLHIPIGKAKPTAKTESRPAEVGPVTKSESTAEPQVKSRLLYDSAGQVLPVRLRTPAESHPINRIERLRLHAHKVIDWFRSTENN